jgi:Flp pilus assembly protein TadD
VIFLGLDGADWELLDGYMKAGVMPTLQALVAEGASGVLETIQPPLSPLVWTTMMTGVSPLQHGILDFTRFNPRSGLKEPITSDERLEPAIWNMASDAGKSVGVFGLWATYPAEPVNGVVVSDRLFSFLYKEATPPAGVAFPPTMEKRAREVLQSTEAGLGLHEMKGFLPWLDEKEYGAHLDTEDPYGHPVSALRRILVETRVYDELARSTFASARPDLTVVYFQATDSIGHVFAPFAPPRQAGITDEEFRRYHGVPEAFFRRIDDLLAAYRRLAQAGDAILMLASDHGFTWSEGRPTRLSSFALATAAKWHRKEGIYLLWGKGIAPAGRDHHGSVKQVCATLLSLLGLPSAGYAYGPALPGAPAVESQGRFDYRTTYKPASIALAAHPAADRETLAKLKALGYVGGAEPMSAPKGAPRSRRTAGSYNNEGLVLRDAGKTEEAVQAFEKALQLDPELTSALWNLSDSLFGNRGDLARSDELLIHAFANGLPEGTRYLVGRAIGYQRAGELERSLNLMARAIAARPDEPELWLFEGRYRVEKGQCRGALEDFRKAVELAPENPAAHASEGLAYLCLGDRTAARKSFERSLELDPGQPKLREQLARM